MKNTLLLASSSPSRQKLLKDAHIPYVVVPQTADERAFDWEMPLQPLVERIAVHKMDHVVLPQPTQEGKICFVVTADTLEDAPGALRGKPTSREDAKAKIKAAQAGMRTGTAFCLDRKVAKMGRWEVDERIIRFVDARYRFIVPDSWIDWYLDHSPALQASGAITIEEVGGLFLQDVQGSYTTIVGLPLFELREALEQLGFF